MSDIDTEMTATPTAVIVGATQMAARYQSSITSMYWSISKGKKPPRVFVSQAMECVLQMKALTELLDRYINEPGAVQ